MPETSPGNIIFVYITCSDVAEAEGIAKLVVEEEIAACANILPEMKSIYRWQGNVETSQEAVLIFKTKKSLFKKLQHRVEQLHSYDVPCIVSFEIGEGSEAYLEWTEKNSA